MEDLTCSTVSIQAKSNGFSHLPKSDTRIECVVARLEQAFMMIHETENPAQAMIAFLIWHSLTGLYAEISDREFC